MLDALHGIQLQPRDRRTRAPPPISRSPRFSRHYRQPPYVEGVPRYADIDLKREPRVRNDPPRPAFTQGDCARRRERELVWDGSGGMGHSDPGGDNGGRMRRQRYRRLSDEDGNARKRRRYLSSMSRSPSRAHGMNWLREQRDAGRRAPPSHPSDRWHPRRMRGRNHRDRGFGYIAGPRRDHSPSGRYSPTGGYPWLCPSRLRNESPHGANYCLVSNLAGHTGN